MLSMQAMGGVTREMAVLLLLALSAALLFGSVHGAAAAALSDLRCLMHQRLRCSHLLRLLCSLLLLSLLRYGRSARVWISCM